MHPDQKYIDALVQNDAILINEVYKKYSPKIAAYIRNNNGDADDAADVFQEALIDIYNKAIAENMVLTCPFDALLTIICRNKWLKKLEKNTRQRVTTTPVEEYNLSDDAFQQAEQVNASANKKKLFDEKFAILGDGCQELLKLSWLGKPLEEVAEILKVTYGYVRKKKSECMGKLTTLIHQSAEYANLKN
jgi:RNA polymerase sigma factor (sigma-70 family)